MFCVPRDHAIGELFGTSIGPTLALTASPNSPEPFGVSCARDTWRIVQFNSLA
jgi:hypothetical protein